MASPYYTPTGAPATNSQGSSSTIRSEFEAIETAMDLLPTLTASYIIRVNAGGSSLEPVEKIPVANGGTGVATFATGEVLVGAGASAVTTETGATLRDTVGVGTGDTVELASLTLNTTPLNVASGGLGSGTHSTGEVLVGAGTSAVTTQTGATLRDTVGVGLTDNPDFAGLKINGITQFNAVTDHFYRNT